MRRFFFVCFPKFPPKERPSSSTNIEEALELLCSASTDLRKLETSLSRGTISLNWCCEAIEFLKVMHSHFFILIEKYEIPRSWQGLGCLELYMEETLSLLDLCNWLKIAIFDMDRYRLIVQFAIKMLSDHHHELPDARIKSEVERLEKESNIPYGFERWSNIINFSKICSPKTKAKNRDSRVVCAIKAIMGVVYVLIFCVIFYPFSVKHDHQVFDQLPQLKPISVSLEKLVCVLWKRLDEVKNESRAVLKEYEMIERAVLDFKAEILKGDHACIDRGKLQESIDLLQSSSVALRDGLQVFDSAVNGLFEEVTTGRIKLLALFNYSRS